MNMIDERENNHVYKEAVCSLTCYVNLWTGYTYIPNLKINKGTNKNDIINIFELIMIINI